ncbi:MAG TPA: YIP1 family protein [Gemmatimonadales bacterium]|nr:YIP1 family protein [Gemmatimonadales bacterium]
MIWEPGAVFERVREKPRFLAPFIVLAVIALGVAAVQLPFTKVAIAGQMAQTPNVTPEQTAAALKVGPIVAVVAPPIFMVLFLLIGAFILWVMVSVLGGEAKFGTLLSVITYSAVSFIALSIVGLIVLELKGTSAISTPADMQPALGLDLLAPGATGFVLAFLKGINPFAIWGVYLAGLGTKITHKTSGGTAYSAAIVEALLLLLVGAALSRG